MQYRTIVLCGVDLNDSEYFYQDQILYPDTASLEFSPRSGPHAINSPMPWRIPIESVILEMKRQLLEPAGIQIYVESRDSALWPKIAEHRQAVQYSSRDRRSAMSSTCRVTEIRLDDAGGAARWDELLCRSPQADVYHRAAYILAVADLEHSQPLGLVVSFNNQQYLLPMLLRPISGPDGQSWFDASTPYGYGGIIRLDCGPTSPIAAISFRVCGSGADIETQYLCSPL